MLEIYFKGPQDSEFQKISEFKPGSWIYAFDANLEDLTKIIELTGLEMADVRDSLDKQELPRIEHIGDNSLFFTRHPSQAEPGMYTQTLTVILSTSYLIAISPGRSEIIEQLFISNTPLGTNQKAKLILHILLKITQDYTHNIKRVRQSIVGAEQPTKPVDSDSILVLTKNEEILNQYLTSLVPLRNVMDSMARGRNMNLYEQDLDLLEDLMIAIGQSEDLCSVNIKSIRSLRDSYHIIFTNDVNRTIKLLTALTIVFTVPTIIASIYGMNVTLPFQGSPSAFLSIMGLTIAISIAAVFIFRHKKWL